MKEALNKLRSFKKWKKMFPEGGKGYSMLVSCLSMGGNFDGRNNILTVIYVLHLYLFCVCFN